jgi:hypothetical protein
MVVVCCIIVGFGCIPIKSAPEARFLNYKKFKEFLRVALGRPKILKVGLSSDDVCLYLQFLTQAIEDSNRQNFKKAAIASTVKSLPLLYNRLILNEGFRYPTWFKIVALGAPITPPLFISSCRLGSLIRTS